MTKRYFILHFKHFDFLHTENIISTLHHCTIYFELKISCRYLNNSNRCTSMCFKSYKISKVKLNLKSKPRKMVKIV